MMKKILDGFDQVMSFCLRLVFWLFLEIGFLRKFRCRVLVKMEFLTSV